jgi:hypothetical protein
VAAMPPRTTPKNFTNRLGSLYYIEHFSRQENGLWMLQETSDSSQLITIPSINCTVTIDDIYEKVDLGAAQTEITRELSDEG